MIPVIDFLGRGGKPALTENDLCRMGAKLYMLGSLAWDYADTVCNISAQLGIQETKKLCRAVRELKRDYDRCRNSAVRDADIAKETELGLLFEQVCGEHFAKLNYGTASDKAAAGLGEDSMMLLKAVQMAMAVLDAMALYAGECDRRIREAKPGLHSIMADHFRRLAILLPHFAGDCAEAGREARKLTARILLNEIKRIDICDEDGTI